MLDSLFLSFFCGNLLSYLPVRLLRKHELYQIGQRKECGECRSERTSVWLKQTKKTHNLQSFHVAHSRPLAQDVSQLRTMRFNLLICTYSIISNVLFRAVSSVSEHPADGEEWLIYAHVLFNVYCKGNQSRSKNKSNRVLTTAEQLVKLKKKWLLLRTLLYGTSYKMYYASKQETNRLSLWQEANWSFY